MQKLLTTVAAIACLTLTTASHADTHTCAAYGAIGCGEYIGKLMTPKFAAKYPPSDYEIVTVYDYFHTVGGGGMVVATMGVVPILRPAPASGLSLMPAYRFSVAKMVVSQQRTPEDDVRMYEAAALRSAARDLMAACEAKPNCDLMTLEK